MKKVLSMLKECLIFILTCGGSRLEQLRREAIELACSKYKNKDLQIRRLRWENRALKQRIKDLLKEG